MNSPLSYSELLSAFLDGELDESTTTALFYTLAHDQDLQLEMRQLIAVRNGFRGGLLTPPEALKHDLQRRLGFPEPVLTPITAATSTSPVARIAQGKPFLMFITALTTSLLTFLLIHTVSEPNRPAPLAPRLDMFLPAPTQNASAYSHGRTISTGISTQRRQQRIAEPPRPVVAGRNISPAGQILSEDGSLIEQVNQWQPEAVAITPELPIVATTVHEQPVTVDEEPAPSSASETNNERSFSLSLRGFSGRSFPAIDLEPLAEPPINNIAAGLLYRLDDHHALGIELGQENLLQRYDGVRNGTGITIEQNYLALWGGVSYRYTLNPSQALQPFGGIVLGGTQTGPMGRLTLGVAYQLGSVSLTAGVEGMLHAFRYQNRWFSTQKINATYGVSFYF